MGNDLPAKEPLTTAASWAALLLALGCLGFVAWYIPADRQRFLAMFRDFKMQLPGATAFMLSIPDVAFPIAAGLLALLALALQWFVRAKSGVVLVHMLIVVLCCVVFVAYRESLFQPLSALINTVSGSRAGG